MKKIIFGLLMLVGFYSNSQEIKKEINDTIKFVKSTEIDVRKSYIEEVNKQTFTTLGNNDLMYYECSNDCTDIVLNISEKYWSLPMLGGGSLKYSKKIKQQTAISISEQYTYLFYSKGFKTLIIKIEGIEPITKDLKLNR
jgi:hypothetical protein